MGEFEVRSDEELKNQLDAPNRVKEGIASFINKERGDTGSIEADLARREIELPNKWGEMSLEEQQAFLAEKMFANKADYDNFSS